MQFLINFILQKSRQAYELEDGVNRIKEMEGLRGIAVLLVFWVHFSQLFSVYSGRYFYILQFLQTIGHAGVDLFFVLSGFLVYGILMRRKFSYGKFLHRRAQRIYPTYLVILGVYLLLSVVFPDKSRIPVGLGPAEAYIAANLLFLPGIFPISPIITVAWSLSFEFLSYLTFPVLVWYLGMQRWSQKRRVWFWVGLSLLLVALSFGTNVFFGDHIRMLMFIAGPLVYELTHSPKQWLRPGYDWAVIGVSASSLLVLYLSFLYMLPVTFSAIALFVGMGALVGYPINVSGPLGDFLRFSPLRWLGNMSYSYYLSHSLVLLSVHRLFKTMLETPYGDTVLMAVYLPLCFFLTLVLSTVVFLFVEKPFSIFARVSVEQPAVARM